MKKNYIKYWVLFIFILLKTAIIPFFLPSGGVTSDSVDYFRIADVLPKVNTDLFPLGYPLLIKLFHLITHDYFYSTKIINVLAILVIGLFSYYKKFYFKETIIFLTLRIFSLFLFSYSEVPFLTLEYFLIYYFHEYFFGKLKGWRFVLPASIIMTSMVLMRYSGLYIYVAIGLFLFYYTIKNKFLKNVYTKSYFYFLVFSALGILSYILFNYINFHDFTGENSRGLPSYTDFWSFTYDNFLGAINIVNPIISSKILHFTSPTMILVGIGLILIDLFFLFAFFICYKKYFKKEINYYHQLLLTIGCVYLVLMIFSEYTQRIETLATRMLCEASFVLFFSFIILFFKCFPAKTKWLFSLGVISLLFSVFMIIKTPTNYLANREKVENALKQRKNIKYFYTDASDPVITTFTIPLINKKIEYINSNIQSGNFNLYILTTLDPFIQLIGDDKDIQDKTQILYNSEIK